MSSLSSQCIYIMFTLAPAYVEHLSGVLSHLELYPLCAFVCSETVHRLYSVNVEIGQSRLTNLWQLSNSVTCQALLMSEVDLC